MGYTTDFDGQFSILPVLSKEHREYLTQFAEIRHMRRDPSKLGPDPLREAVKLPVGPEGDYYVGQLDKYESQGWGQPTDDSILDQNYSAASQPGLWCQWVPNEDGSAIVWDGGEKFYNYVEWLQYLIDQFLSPWGYALAGMVYWQGEESDDRGRLVIESPLNVVKVETAIITYGGYR